MAMKNFKFKFKKHKYNQKDLKKWENTDISNLYSGSDTQGVDRLVESKIYSRSFLKEKYISEINHFSEVRDFYLDYLQKVVNDNCICSEYPFNKSHVDSLSLELEQYALLACLDLKIYQKSISDIVNEIEKCTQRKEVHEDIKKLLSELIRNKEASCIIKTERSAMDTSENFSQIPIISSTRTDNENQIPQTEPVSDSVNPGGGSCDNQEFPNNDNSNEVLDSHTNDEQNKESTCCNTETSTAQAQQINESPVIPVQCSNIEEVSTQPDDLNEPEWQDEADSALAPRNHLEARIEEMLKETEKFNQQEKNEKEKAYIAKILNDDSSDDNSFDNLSGGEEEAKENFDESNFLKSLEKMRELFSSDDEAAAITNNKPKPLIRPVHTSRKPRPSIWKHEKFIQLHKFSVLSTEMSFERQKRNRSMFLELFGEDSDEEHGEEYRCTEAYRASCVERISRWVVKYLMPYYHSRKIIGRNVFKTLAHHISERVIDKIQYPDEWTIRYFVSRFFPPRKKYICDADVLEFQFD